MHVGFEPSAVLGGNSKLGDTWKLLSWQLSGSLGGARGKGQSANGHSNGSSNANGHSNGQAAVTTPPLAEELVSSDGRLRIL